MPARKRASDDAGAANEPVAKRRSSRQASAAAAAPLAAPDAKEVAPEKTKPRAATSKKRADAANSTKAGRDTRRSQPPAKKTAGGEKKKKKKQQQQQAGKESSKAKPTDDSLDASDVVSPTARDTKGTAMHLRAVSEDADVDSIPAVNPEAPRHDGEWYWLMKAEPESRFENGIDVRFSIDDLRAREKPEGWDGIRAYAARNHMRSMNAGDKAFFYHSNCREPGIAGIMEIVKEFSEDTTARRPGMPYYDPQSTKENPRWSLVHVEFRKKFAVPIGLKELRELGKLGGPLERMQMLKQSRLSVSQVSGDEWKALCEIADKKAKDAGLEHEMTKLST